MSRFQGTRFSKYIAATSHYKLVNAIEKMNLVWLSLYAIVFLKDNHFSNKIQSHFMNGLLY